MKKLKKEYPLKKFSSRDYPLEGFTDTHIHTAPDVKPTLKTDIGAAMSAKEELMQSIVLKNHNEPTSGRAIITSEVTGFQVFGVWYLTISSVGGLNPHAVEVSVEMGGKFVWFPTISYSSVEMDWAKVEEILQIVAENNMAVATGHLKPADIFTLIDMARSLGIWRIIVNHPLIRVVGASLDEQVEMSAHAYLEHCYVACMENHDKFDS